MSATSASLACARREAEGSRAARRLRRAGKIPGIVYGGGQDPLAVQVDWLTLMRTLAHAGQVIELDVEGMSGIPVLIKETDRHPVTSQPRHVDFLRVRLDVAIQTTVVVELVGADDAPGIKEGGILEQVTREITVEALPGDIPDEAMTHDVSHLEAAATVTLADLTPPPRVTFVDDPETVIATVTVPKMEVEADTEMEQETERVGDPDAAAENLGEDAPDEPGTAPG